MKILSVKATVGTILLLLLVAVSSPAASGQVPPLGGEELFNSKCAKCHGLKGIGTGAGPPLVHRIYEPNHHSDFSFRRALSMGVRAHHWRFGNMEKVTGLTPEQVELIIKYIREIQQDAGIF